MGPLRKKPEMTRDSLRPEWNTRGDNTIVIYSCLSSRQPKYKEMVFWKNSRWQASPKGAEEIREFLSVEPGDVLQELNQEENE